MASPEEIASRLLQDLPGWPKGRLPSLRALAIRYVASTRTVQGALDLLRDSGAIVTRPRSGCWRAGEAPEAASRERRQTSEDLGERLSREIREGLHPFDAPLPSLKELAHQWGCHVQTAAKALDVPLRAGLLMRRGRMHFPVLPRPRPSRGARPTILCIGSEGGDGGFEIEFERESDFWRELGATAAHSGVVLERISWKHCDETEVSIPVGPSILGVVASTWHLCDPEMLLPALERLRVPVCVWVESPSFLEHLGARSRLHVHDQGYGPAIGAQVARHLLDLGHRHLAYISPWHGGLWSRNRLQGIEREVARHGATIDPFLLEEAEEVAYFARARMDPLLAGRFPASDLEAILPSGVDAVREFVVRQLGWSRIRQDLESLLEKALASGATAWICANDPTALIARAWLRDRGVPIPGEVSLVGFDDTTEALRADLTTFRFASGPMARAMVLQILSGDVRGGATRHMGTVIARGSTRRPGDGMRPPTGLAGPGLDGMW